eukprot:10575397-Heterocapsa_arctica.AAC.1
MCIRDSLKGTVPSRPLELRLEGEALDYYNNFASRIELGALDIERRVAAGGLAPVRPYWDVRLRADRALRIDFLLKL